MFKLLRSKILEYFFLTLTSIGLSINVFSSFYITSKIATNYFVLVGIVLIIMTYLFLINSSSKSMVIGYTSLIVACMIFIRAFYPKPFSKVVLILIVCAVLCNLCSKSKITFLLFSIAAVIVSAAFKFLMYPVNNFCFVITIIGIISESIIVFSHMGKETAYGEIKQGHVAIQSMTISFVTIALAFCVFTFIVVPLNPPTREIKLLTKMMSFDVLERVGVAASVEIPSDKESQETEDSNKKNEDKDETPDEKKENDKNSNEKEEKNLVAEKNHKNFLSATPISYDDQTFQYSIIILVILLVSFPFILKFVFRRKRNRQIEKLCSNEKLIYIYTYMLRLFSKLGIKRMDTLTLCEYVNSEEAEFTKYDSEGGVKFKDLTQLYEEIVYGSHKVTREELDMLKEYYCSFLKNVRRNNKIVKRLRLFFFI